jgi:hypothetical protein
VKVLAWVIDDMGRGFELHSFLRHGIKYRAEKRERKMGPMPVFFYTFESNSCKSRLQLFLAAKGGV